MSDEQGRWFEFNFTGPDRDWIIEGLKSGELRVDARWQTSIPVENGIGEPVNWPVPVEFSIVRVRKPAPPPAWGDESVASKRIQWRGNRTISGYCLLWGSPDQKDVYGQYFTPESDITGLTKLHHIHFIYRLTAREDVYLPVGKIERLRINNLGIFVDATLFPNIPHPDGVSGAIDNPIIKLRASGGDCYFVTEARHAEDVEFGGEGFIRKWPVLHILITATPTDPR